jgi:hypothetical protein
MTSSSAIKVKDIRKAVIDEYSHLKNIDPVDFKIYQNKKAWEENRQPLLKNSLISGGSRRSSHCRGPPSGVVPTRWR